ncbi:hypothetical protein OG783_14035 [Streptomyces jietaisiensis]|uniref:hypothetical protein n=1 Tax=Streptomyces griseoaurantiacus TaxID=68213 RepID=UPI0032549FE6
MGSLRNPVGPLPSSIYWRRRAVLLAVLGVLALLVVWFVALGGGGGKKSEGGGDGKNPAPSITPGPSSSGPAISRHPGGRDESGGGEDGGSGGSGGSDGSGDGAGDSDGTGTGAGAGGGGSAGGTEGGAGSGGVGGVSGEQVPAGSTLPNCTTSAVTLNLSSVHNTYAPEQTPTLRLTARNTSAGDCKIDLGPKHAVLTITQTGEDEDFWASDDCVEGSGSVLFRVPAQGSATYTVKWDREPSAAHCATPKAGKASAGTYLVEAKAEGFTKARTSFVLAKD